MRFIMKIQIHQMEDSSEEEEDTLAIFKNELSGLPQAIDEIEKQLHSIGKKLKAAETDLVKGHVVPATNIIKNWCVEQGLPESFTLDEWITAVFKSATKMDLESRQLYFCESAPWGTQVNLFDLIRGIPGWFTVLCRD